MKHILSILVLLAVIQSSRAVVPANALYLNRGRGYGTFTTATPDGLRIDNSKGHDTLTDTIGCRFVGRYSVTFTAGTQVSADNTHAWGVSLSDGKAVPFTVEVRNEQCRNASLTPRLAVVCRYDNDSTVAYITRNADLYGRENIWRISVADGRIEVGAGNRGINSVAALECPVDGIKSLGFSAAPGTALVVRDIAVESLGNRVSIDGRFADPYNLRAIVNESSDPLAGYWRMLDYALDDSLVRLGGDYRLAIVPDGNVYRVIYISGAATNNGEWLPGAVKATMIPTAIPGTYHLDWKDSDGRSIDKEGAAQLEPANTLSLQFPALDSSVRLIKE